MILMPVLFAAFGSAALAAVAIYQRTEADSNCRKLVFGIQRELAPVLEQLLKLNAQARRLRKVRGITEQKRLLALTSLMPPAIAAAEAELNAVISQQSALALLQRELLSEARLIRQRHRTPLRATGVTRFIFQTPRKSLAVHPEPPTSLTPDYVPDADFEAAQEQRFSYKQKLFIHLSAGFAKLVGSGGREKEYGCSATLKEKEWRPVLRAVNL